MKRDQSLHDIHNYILTSNHLDQWIFFVLHTDGKYSAQVMYASSVKDFCPVAALRLMISKTEPEATSLFNRHIKGKIKSRCEGIDLEKN
jgi:hypothetical protein